MSSKFPRSIAMPCITFTVCLLLVLLPQRISTKPILAAITRDESILLTPSRSAEDVDHIAKRQVEDEEDEEVIEYDEVEDDEEQEVIKEFECNYPENTDQSDGTPSLPSSLWPDGIITYEFDPNLSFNYRMLFQKAMDMWSASTCIKFVLNTMFNPNENYIVLTATSNSGGETMCSSAIGRQLGEQVVQLTEHCNNIGHAVHELGHAIGLFHEHSREDRDSYINVNTANILNNINYVREFEKINREKNYALYPDVGYDIQSIMHYNELAGSIDGRKKTITIREDANLEDLQCSNRLPMGQRRRLSYLDIRRVNCLYRCNAPINVTKPKCVIPTPTPTTASPSSSTTTMPTPSATLPIATPAPLNNKLKSGNVILLKLKDDTYGLQCTPSCTPKRCVDFLSDSCNTEVQQFEIIKTNTSTNRKVASGNTVLIRSIKLRNQFLECVDRSSCTLSTCNEDNLNEEISNSSYISSCAKHQFQIFGYTRKGALRNDLTTRDHLQFKDRDSDGLLDCSGKYCILQDEACPTKHMKKSMCTLQSFKAEKLKEQYVHE